MPTELSMPDKQMIRKAADIAVQVHGLQHDLGGQPYLYHCARVAMSLESPVEQVCGWLHDVLEDAEDLEGYAEIIEKEFPACVIVCCQTLCRKVNESYEDYIASVALDPLATKIKIQDCMDNLMPDRLRRVPTDKRWKLKERYEAALQVLTKSTAAG